MAYSEIWMENLRYDDAPSSKFLMLTRLMIRHLLQLGISKNSLEISKLLLKSIKDYMNRKNLRVGYKKGFLDGAYKIMIFKNIRIEGKEIIIMDGHVAENSLMNGMKESVMLTNLLQSLFTNEQVLRAYLKVNKESVLRIPTNSPDIPNIEPLANLMIELEQEESDNNKPPGEAGKEMGLFQGELKFHETSSIVQRNDDCIDVGTDLNSGIVSVFNNSKDSLESGSISIDQSSIHPSFKYLKNQSEITVYLDNRAILQFLSDSVKYLECVRQVKRLNDALMNQFQLIQQKIQDVDIIYEKSKKEKEEKRLMDHSENDERSKEDFKDIGCQCDMLDDEVADYDDGDDNGERREMIPHHETENENEECNDE